MTQEGRIPESVARINEKDWTKAAALIDETIDYSMTLEQGIYSTSPPWNSQEILQYFRDANKMVQLLDNTSRKKELNTLLHEGVLNDVRFDIPVIPRKAYREDPDWPEGGSFIGDAEAACRRRRAIARLFIKDPKAASEFVDSGVTFVHGTGAVALPSILKNGLMSSAELDRRQAPLLTGERITSTYDSNKIAFYEWDNFFRAERHAFHYGVKPKWLLCEIAEENGPAIFKRGGLLRETIAKIEAEELCQSQLDVLNDVYEVIIGVGSRAVQLYEMILHPSCLKKPLDASEPHFKTSLLSPDHILYVFAPKGKIEQTKKIIASFSREPNSARVMSMKLMSASLNPDLDIEKFLSQTFED